MHMTGLAVRRVLLGLGRFLAMSVPMIVTVVMPVVMPVVMIAAGSVNVVMIVCFRVNERGVQFSLDGKRNLARAVLVFGQHGHDFRANTQIIDST